LEIELDFIEDIISESFLCYLASSFSECPLSHTGDDFALFPLSIPQMLCLPFPMLLSLVSSNDLNVAQECLVFFFVDCFMKRLARKTDIEASILQDISPECDQITQIFDAFYAHKSEEGKQAVVNLMFASIRLEFVETKFILEFLNGNTGLGRSDFRRDCLIRRLMGRQSSNMPRQHLANRKPVTQSSQTAKTFNEIVEWITDEALHDHCFKLIKDREDRVKEMRNKVEVLEKQTKEKEIAFTKYKKMIEDSIKPPARKVKPGPLQESHESISQYFISTYCQIF